MKLRKTALAVAASVATLVPLIVATSAEAESPPTCYGSTCRDLNTADTNCVSDATTLYGLDANNYGYIEMRYSKRCHANWVRFTPFSQFGSLALGMHQVDGRPWIWRDGVADSPRGKVGESTVYSIYPQSKWTAMVSAQGRTCMSVDLYDYGDSTQSGIGGFEYRDLGNYTAGCFS